MKSTRRLRGRKEIKNIATEDECTEHLTRMLQRVAKRSLADIAQILTKPD